MERRLYALKCLTLALDALITRGEPLDRERLLDLTEQYGRSVTLKRWEAEPFFALPLLEAIEHAGIV